MLVVAVVAAVVGLLVQVIMLEVAEEEEAGLVNGLFDPLIPYLLGTKLALLLVPKVPEVVVEIVVVLMEMTGLVVVIQ
ncbi:hypothetical protein [Candidatus Igneacidithiobacillus taiwanensis]|uniref:hypothetical protein n=1 Tax=Candidatus Igneacidithiobacillus taiwanensis TaxID=1945924 RepID=UPI00289833A0|nr:hypothetical protein [Candidatus Igneacidithiobacillus taiwanensis]